MSQNPKPHFQQNFVMDQRRQGRGLDETADSLSLLPWVQVPFTVDFRNYNAQYSPCAYTKDRLGFVHLRGLFLCTKSIAPSVNAVIFQMPPGFYPAIQEIFHCHASFGVMRLDITTAGQFVWTFPAVGTYAANCYVSLGAITWHAAPQ